MKSSIKFVAYNWYGCVDCIYYRLNSCFIQIDTVYSCNVINILHHFIVILTFINNELKHVLQFSDFIKCGIKCWKIKKQNRSCIKSSCIFVQCVILNKVSVTIDVLFINLYSSKWSAYVFLMKYLLILRCYALWHIIENPQPRSLAHISSIF